MKFANIVEKLGSIAEKQANNQPLTDDTQEYKAALARGDYEAYYGYYSRSWKEYSDVKFIANLIEVHYGSGGPPSYSGWYPSMFFGDGEKSSKPDPLVADIHTDVADDMSPGCVLHNAVGNVNAMFVAIDRGDKVFSYVGPVYTHYEFPRPVDQRLDDSEWKEIVAKNQQPPLPVWTKSYLVPATPTPPATQ